MTDTRSRNYCFTIQENENASNGETTMNHLQGNPTVKALFIGGIEKAPTTNKLHRHCVVSFHNKKSLEQVIKLLTPHHVEPMRSTPRQAIEYALKDTKEFLINTYQFINENDTKERVVELILEGKTLAEIMRECPKTMCDRYTNIEKMYFRYHYDQKE